MATFLFQSPSRRPPELSTVISAIQLIVGKAGRRIGPRDRIEHDAMAMRAESDEGGAGAYRNARSDAAPHDGAAPLDRRLLRDAFARARPSASRRRDQQLRPDLRIRSSRSAHQRRDAIGVVAITGDAMPHDAQLRSRGVRRVVRYSSICKPPRCTNTAASGNRRAHRAARSRRPCRSDRLAPIPSSAARSCPVARDRYRARIARARRSAAG